MIFFEKKEKAEKSFRAREPFNPGYGDQFSIVVPYVQSEIEGNDLLTSQLIKVLHEETNDYVIQRFGRSANYSLRLKSFSATWNKIAEQLKDSLEESKSGTVDFRVLCHWGPMRAEVMELRVRIKAKVKGSDPLKVKIQFNSGDLESSALAKALTKGYKQAVSYKSGFM